MAQANKNRNEFRQAMEKALGYCIDAKVPHNVQQEVYNYFEYAWLQQKTLGNKI